MVIVMVVDTARRCPFFLLSFGPLARCGRKRCRRSCRGWFIVAGFFLVLGRHKVLDQLSCATVDSFSINVNLCIVVLSCVVTC